MKTEATKFLFIQCYEYSDVGRVSINFGDTNKGSREIKQCRVLTVKLIHKNCCTCIADSTIVSRRFVL